MKQITPWSTVSAVKNLPVFRDYPVVTMGANSHEGSRRYLLDNDAGWERYSLATPTDGGGRLEDRHCG